MSEDTINRVLHDLKVIGAINEKDKIYTRNGLLNLDHGSPGSSALRFIRGESRTRGVAAITNVVEDAFAIAENAFRKLECLGTQETRDDHVKKLKSYHLIYKIRCNISDCLIGFKNLKSTYVDDTSISARIEVLREKVAQGLKELDVSVNILRSQLDIEDIESRYGEYLIRDDLYMI